MAFRMDLDALVLAALQSDEMHGYEIVKRLKQSGSDSLAVGEGLLYPALHKMEREGLICATWHPQQGKPSRKIYALTDKGRKELEHKRVKWAEFASAVTQMLAPKVAEGA